jgi:hypothetical protein
MAHATSALARVFEATSRPADRAGHHQRSTDDHRCTLASGMAYDHELANRVREQLSDEAMPRSPAVR